MSGQVLPYPNHRPLIRYVRAQHLPSRRPFRVLAQQKVRAVLVDVGQGFIRVGITLHLRPDVRPHRYRQAVQEPLARGLQPFLPAHGRALGYGSRHHGFLAWFIFASKISTALWNPASTSRPNPRGPIFSTSPSGSFTLAKLLNDLRTLPASTTCSGGRFRAYRPKCCKDRQSV